jgi:nucleoside-diphosphate-sugar epimerase
MENKKNVLIIGGTGIVGFPIVNQLILHNDHNVYSVALDKGYFPESVHQYIVDRNTEEFSDLIKKLTSEVEYRWDAVIDVFSFGEETSKVTYELFKNSAAQIITISTTLVYDRSKKNSEPITEQTPLAEKGRFGGYVDGKVGLDSFWQGVTDVNWTLLRPYHIVGAGSLLGCIPECNRDPKLLEKIKQGEVLRLCNGGEVLLNCIHPKDIAMAVYKIIGNKNTFKQAYNLVNPEVVVAKDYYAEIAKQVGGKLNIENVPMSTIWEESKGWEMTTLPHVYSMEKLNRDIGYVPNTPLSEQIKDAIANHPVIAGPNEEIPIHKRMNKLPRPKKIDWLV